jgi:integrase
VSGIASPGTATTGAITGRPRCAANETHGQRPGLTRSAALPAADRLNPHSLRHTFVTTALDAGVPLRDVQDAAGHADPRTTRRYDRARHNLDRHATYTVTTFLSDDGS